MNEFEKILSDMFPGVKFEKVDTSKKFLPKEFYMDKNYIVSTTNPGQTIEMSVVSNPNSFDPSPFHPVDKPEHYNKNGIEAWDAIKASLTKEEWEGYCKGNAIKYLWRYRYKNGVEDLKKAQRYLERLIESLDGPTKKETQK